MKITFEQSGGFAGLNRRLEIDTEELKSIDAVVLMMLIDEANFFSLPARIISPRPQPDRFSYSITVTTNEGTHTVNVSEEAITEGVEKLVRWLRERGESKWK